MGQQMKNGMRTGLAEADNHGRAYRVRAGRCGLRARAAGWKTSASAIAWKMKNNPVQGEVTSNEFITSARARRAGASR